MGTSRKRRVKALEPLSEIGAKKDCDEVEKSGKRSVRQQFHKATGQIEKDGHSSPSGKVKALSSRLESETTSSMEKSTKLPVLDLNRGETVPAKIKLQLFPIDESTRLGLEKDGFNPYLELTLSAKKKIPSVLKHLDSKWGSSSIAVGEPLLFPYNRAENLDCYRWTRNDTCISARDVHLAIGSPAVFRLRYGWVSDPGTRTQTQPSALATLGASSKFEDLQKDHMQKTYGNGDKTEVRGKESEAPIIASVEKDAVVAQRTPSNEAVYSMDNEVKMDDGIGQSLALWADSLTNISIGGLLSEASLQGFCNFDPKSNGSNEGLQSSQLTSDSFDAFLSGRINHSQNPMPPPQGSHSSILDAEDTCHAFSFKKSSSLYKDAIASSGSAYSHASCQDTSSKPFKHPNAIEANTQLQGQACQQSDTDLLHCSRAYNDESSLGLSGIKWTDSLGPFDLGPSSSRKIISGDSISIGGIVNS